MQENSKSNEQQFHKSTMIFNKSCVWNRGDVSKQLPNRCDKSLCDRADLSQEDLSNSKS